MFCILMMLKAMCVCVWDGALFEQWSCRGVLNKRAGGRFNIGGIFGISLVRKFNCQFTYIERTHLFLIRADRYINRPILGYHRLVLSEILIFQYNKNSFNTHFLQY